MTVHAASRERRHPTLILLDDDRAVGSRIDRRTRDEPPAPTPRCRRLNSHGNPCGRPSAAASRRGLCARCDAHTRRARAAARIVTQPALDDAAVAEGLALDAVTVAGIRRAVAPDGVWVDQRRQPQHRPPEPTQGVTR